MVVIYAEKPDMGEKIAAALGGDSFHKSEKSQGYYKIMYRGVEHAVTWGYGHLCALAEATDYNAEFKNWRKLPLPFIPDNFKIVLNEKSKMPVGKAFKVVKQLFEKADWIINATDFDREGELIFFYLYSFLGCRKPVMRVKLDNTMKSGIQDAFSALMDSSQFKGILMSAQCRSIADWVVGCNLTVAMTLHNDTGNVYPIGRVQTPTLAMVVERDKSIRNFKPEDYFTLAAEFTTPKGETYKGIHEAKRFASEQEADAHLARCDGHGGTVAEVKNKERMRMVPNLYSLDTLQMDANSRYGMSLKRTLDATQKLYEKGFVTYPRTDCQFLPESMMPKIAEIQEMLKRNGFSNLFNHDADAANMQANKKHYFDDSKLGSHYAIIPTEAPAAGLTGDEQKVYGLVADSVIRMLYPPAKLLDTKVRTDVNGEAFLTSGTAIAEKGWLFVNGETKEELLPDLAEGEQVSASCQKQAKKTEPPKHFTDKTLLSAMISAGKTLDDEDLRKFMAEQEIEGIGTVATRAQIIESLLARGLLVREKKSILATERGAWLVDSIPVGDVKSAVLTARCEKKLDMVAKGDVRPDDFLKEIYGNVKAWCDAITNTPAAGSGHASPDVKKDANTSIMCPVCGSPMRKFQWGFGCSEYRNGCKFGVGKICGKILTEKQVKELLSREKLGPVSGFARKDGSKFEATLKLEPVEENGKIVNYKIVFDSPQSKMGEKPDVYATCPDCHKKIVRGKWGWECGNQCGLRVPYTICERDIQPNEAEALFAHKSTDILSGFTSKAGKPFSAGLKLEGKKVSFYFPER